MVKVTPLTDEDLAPRGNNNYFDEGVHNIYITKAVRGTTDNGKEYVEFTVLGEEDQEGTARLWFTTDKSAKYALSILAGIAVHNKDTEADKQKVRDAFKKITDTDEVSNKFLERFKNYKAWYRVSKSDRTYTAQDGSTKYSYDKDIAGYELKPKQLTAEQLTADFLAEGEASDPDAIPFE